jgi:alpha-1,2-mannosyltransferase
MAGLGPAGPALRRVRGAVGGARRRTIEPPSWQSAALAFFPLLMAAAFVRSLFADPSPGFHRFRDLHVFWLAGGAYLHGHAVYPSLATVAHPSPSLAGNLFVYPAPMAALLVPLSLLPYAAVCVLFPVASIGALAGALRLLGVRDWRCYAALALWPATVQSLTIGTLSPWLVLVAAALWRFRDRRLAAAGLAALLLITKLFLWPLLLWLAAARRSRTAMLGAAAALSLSVLAWLPLGGISAYPRLLHELSLQELGASLQPVRLVPGSPASQLLVLEAAVALAAVLLAWSSRRVSEMQGFVLAIGLSLLGSPILWPHYLVLLAVPLAIRSPRLTPVWLVPLAMWIYPSPVAPQHVWPALVGATVIVWAILGSAGARPRGLARSTPRPGLSSGDVPVSG